ncbi:hypothetical protein N7517_008659 [Penicillium concentricum]|uniref:HD domain-containing protein n=1 Tax=Penicillium concentricum TaxID=293559 RepID=A0A9W9RXP3_9EURO|nr:uncharacterized protein N7517_008659 [Penicillium concentricum]KAJ5365773.1 hypothetical protein N7517_008659 [Penicillium concentricum]
MVENFPFNSTLINTNLPPTPILETPLAQRINAYARTSPKDHTATYDRSGSSNGTDSRLRTGTLDKTFFLACLLHDIGSTETSITRLSFEFFDDVLALRVLQTDTQYIHEDEDEADVGVHVRDRGTYTCFSEARAPHEQAESVTEIIRYRDLSLGGITVGQLLQLAMYAVQHHQLISKNQLPCR